jgi:S-DNA-T family DNA segregation ATPase FtsK/SpoIIIE
LLTDDDVQAIAYRWTRRRPILDTPSQEAADDYAASVTAPEPIRRIPKPRVTADDPRIDDNSPRSDTAADASLWIALSTAPPEGISVPELMKVSGMSRPWVYRRLAMHFRAERVTQVSRGRWRATRDEGGASDGA